MKKVKYEIFERNYVPYLGAKGQGQENQWICFFSQALLCYQNVIIVSDFCFTRLCLFISFGLPTEWNKSSNWKVKFWLSEWNLKIVCPRYKCLVFCMKFNVSTNLSRLMVVNIFRKDIEEMGIWAQKVVWRQNIYVCLI